MARPKAERAVTADVSLAADRLTVQGIPAEKLTGKLALEGETVRYELEGKTVWESKHDVTNDFFGVKRVAQGDSVQAALDKNMWERVLSLLAGNLPPSHVFSPESSRGLGVSRLTGGGPVPNAR